MDAENDELGIAVIGAGAYVTGRNGFGVGVVLASLLQASKTLPVSVCVTSRSQEARTDVLSAADRLNRMLGTTGSVKFVLASGSALQTVQALRSGWNPTAAIICVPDSLHFSYAEACLQEGLECLVVKPLTPTVVEAEALVSLQERLGRIGFVEFHKRYDTQNLWVKSALASGRIGRPLVWDVTYSQPASVPLKTFRSWASTTNIFQYLGVHYADLIYFMTGYLPVAASAHGQRGLLAENGIDADDTVHATILWSNQNGDTLTSHFAMSWAEPSGTSAFSSQSYTILGTQGRLNCDQACRGIRVTDNMKVEEVNPYFTHTYPAVGDDNATFGGYGYDSILTFLQAVRQRRSKGTRDAQIPAGFPTFRDALPSTLAVDLVNASLRAGGEWRRRNDLARR